MRRRKRLTMLVTVSVPVDTTAAEARREVRTLINDQANWSDRFYDEVKAVGVRGVAKRK